MKLRHYLRYPVDIARAKVQLNKRTSDGAIFQNRPIALDLHTADLLIDCGRHFAAIAHYASQNQSIVALRCPRLLLSAIAHKPFGAQMLAMENVRWIAETERLPDNAIVLTDILSDAPSRPMGDARCFQMLIGKEVLRDVPVMPYPMHPGVLTHANDESIQAARKTANRQGIFFAGSQRAKYGRDVIRKHFGVLNRLEILETIRHDFADRVATEQHDRRDPMPIILPPTESGDAAVPIAIDQWLPTLARHQFFLCCPGIAQPMCHNIIEAMSVGVIPIIEYPDRFDPMLTDGVNAIIYQGRSGLRGAIERIDTFSDDHIRHLSENVVNHYDQHLDNQQFFADLIATENNQARDQICLPFHDENLSAMKSHLVEQPLAA